MLCLMRVCPFATDVCRFRPMRKASPPTAASCPDLMRLPAREADSSDLFDQATVDGLCLIPARCISSRTASFQQSASCGQVLVLTATVQTYYNVVVARARAEKLKLVPHVLRWARERAGLAPQGLAAKMKVPADDIAEWEKDGRVGLPQVRSLGHHTLTPLGYLFLKSPPDDSLPVADFRTVGKAAPRRPSPELFATMMAMMRRQDWICEEAAKYGDPPLEFVNSHNHQESLAEKVAQHMRDTFKLPTEWQSGMSVARARAHLFDCMENAGILTFISGIVGNHTHRPLDPAEFRGFALVDQHAPLVFINGNDSHAAQMFTLAHEAAHLYIGKSGVSLCDVMHKNQAAETFCNKAAACFLVPDDSLRNRWHSIRSVFERIDEVSQAFCVSKLVIAFRARELGLLTPMAFREFYAGYEKEAGAMPKRQRSSGGNFWNTQKYRMGERFGDSVVRAVLAGEMLDREAWELTDLNRKTFDELVEKRRMLV